MSITPNVLAARYATKEMVAIFDPVNKVLKSLVSQRRVLSLNTGTYPCLGEFILTSTGFLPINFDIVYS